MQAICMCSYIYEGAANGSANIASPADRIARTHQPQTEILSLLDYRTRYNQYNTDVGEHSVGIAPDCTPCQLVAGAYILHRQRQVDLNSGFGIAVPLLLQTPRPCAHPRRSSPCGCGRLL
jgi:PhoD-like phosphatase